MWNIIISIPIILLMSHTFARLVYPTDTLSKILYVSLVPTPLSRALWIYHVSMVGDLSFNSANFGQSPTTQSSKQSPHLADTEVPTSPTTDWCSPGWMTEVMTPGKHTFHLQYTATCVTQSYPHSTNLFLTSAWNNNTTSSKENFPTVPLDDNVSSEYPIPDRCLCIQDTSDEPNHQCSYPCPYWSTTFRMDLLQTTPWNEAVFYYDLMDFSDISSDLPDIMMTTSDNDIPDLVDVLDAVWFE